MYIAIISLILIFIGLFWAYYYSIILPKTRREQFLAQQLQVEYERKLAVQEEEEALYWINWYNEQHEIELLFDKYQNKLILKREKEIVKLWSQYLTDEVINSDSFIKILGSKPISDIGYSDQLNSKEWKFVRLKVLLNGHFKCRSCTEVSLYNHVHHTYYIKNKLAWEIPFDSLQCYCKSCHYSIHRNNEIPIFITINDKFEFVSHVVHCWKCNGSGYLPEYDYHMRGVCFACDGRKTQQLTFRETLQDYKDFKKRFPTFSDNVVKNEIRSLCRDNFKWVDISIFEDYPEIDKIVNGIYGYKH